MKPYQQTNKQCREIIQAIVQRCDNNGSEWEIAFGPDWGGNSLTVYDRDLGHTHVGSPEDTFAHFVDQLHGTLCRGTGLSYAPNRPTQETPDGKQ